MRFHSCWRVLFYCSKNAASVSSTKKTNRQAGVKWSGGKDFNCLLVVRGTWWLELVWIRSKGTGVNGVCLITAASRSVTCTQICLQIALERGLPALIVWLILIGVYLRMLWRITRRESVDDFARGVALGALGGVLGFFMSGLVHYNWGDSEVVAVFYFIMGLVFGS